MTILHSKCFILRFPGGEPQPYPFVAVQDAVPSDIAGTSASYVHTSGPPTRRKPAQSSGGSITSPVQDDMFGPPKRHEPTIQHLKQFERDPATALISLAINSGHNRFRAASRLYSNTNTLDLEDPDTLQIEDELEAGFTDDG
ncbi:hypothetical protein GHT06_016952 [Daphnia sinensis]|uniref:Uncharacterized protein n=1 Tax=Daphnia sinensis TaxID=1820382 RepID=A0AAD5PVM0_9CRUS|nr:hypothetical protein GHT06_016952 [Daphnia sinensis]